MVPDFGFLMPWRPARIETHSAVALLTFCLPVAAEGSQPRRAAGDSSRRARQGTVQRIAVAWDRRRADRAEADQRDHEQDRAVARGGQAGQHIFPCRACPDRLQLLLCRRVAQLVRALP